MNCYELLGVRKDVTLKELKARYHELAFELHPDRNPLVETGERFAQVSVAYEFLRKKLEGVQAAGRVSKTQPRGSSPRPSATSRGRVSGGAGKVQGPKKRCASCGGSKRKKIQKGFHVTTLPCKDC